MPAAVYLSVIEIDYVITLINRSYYYNNINWWFMKSMYIIYSAENLKRL